MPVTLAVGFIVTQIVEIWLLIQVGHAIGGWQTLALLVIDSLIGAWLLRREGRRTWSAFRLALQERRVPAKEVADGALVLVGGTLLLTPGFLSDIVGLICLLPPSRAVLRRMLTGTVLRRLGLVGLVGGAAMGSGPAAPSRASARPRSGADVIDGDVLEGEVLDEVVTETDPRQHEGPPPTGGRP